MTPLHMLLCMVGISSPGACMEQSTWINRKYTHYETTRDSDKLQRSTADFSYYAKELENDADFKRHLDNILIPRTVGSSNHAKVRSYIVNEMRQMGWTVEEDRFQDNTPFGQKQFTNVIATLNPKVPRRMVFACHYDSKIDPPGFLGAIDSAVPCAMMINLAKTMKEDLKLNKAKQSELTIQFLFLDGEEAFKKWEPTDSIYGARHLASKLGNQGFTHENVPGKQLDRIDIFVLLDLIGTTDTQFALLEGSTRDWYKRLVSIEKSMRNSNLISGPTIFQDFEINAGIEDDHIPFKRRNVPILHLISVPFPKVWHKITDNGDNLNLKRTSHISKVLRAFTAEYLHLV